MSAKSKASNKEDANNASLESNQNTELEKKVDALLSIEEPQIAETPEEPKAKKSIPVAIHEYTEEPEAPVEAAAEPEPVSDTEAGTKEPAGAPLLPSDQLPDLNEVSEPEIVTEAPEEEIAPDPGQTPLLPDDLLPITDDQDDPVVDMPIEEPAEEEASEKLKFYESSGPKPVAPEKLKDSLGLEEAGTSRAVDEIVAKEADELLDARDHDYRFVESSTPTPVKSPKKKQRWFRKKWLRDTILLILLIGIGAVAAVPASRYYLLNAAGVRAGASVMVMDETNGQPLKNAEFSIDGISGKTDKAGEAKLENIKLGPQKMVIKKAAFAETSRSVTLGWGSNPLGEFKLKPVGLQYKISVIDFLSKKPVAKIEALTGEANAISNEKGEIVITVPRDQADTEKIAVELSGDGVRSEKIEIKLGATASSTVEMVPSRKHAFISKRTGTYDVYKIDVDGKNEEKVLTGTGNEKPDSIALAAHPSKDVVALVSTRDSTRTKEGAAMSALTMIDLSNNATKTVVQSERIQLVGWIDDKLAYVKIADNEDTNSQNRHKLMAYNVNSGTDRDLVSTNYFNDIIQVGKSIYYTPAAFNVNGAVGLYKINIDGNEKRTVYDKEVWNLFRTSYNELSVSMGQEWFTLNLDNDTMAKAAGAPAVMKSRVYVPNASGSNSLWVDDRDGKDVLLEYTSDTKADKTLQSKSGIKNPLRWLTDNDIIYRVSNNQETADYILDVNGGEPRKIKDVTDTAGIDRWYYY